jgi:hypothetical protein
MQQKLRKQVSLDFLDYTKNNINELLRTKIPQSTKQKLCIIIEKLLNETKSYNGYKNLYWTRFGHLDWDEAKQKAVYKEIPRQFITGPDDSGKMDFVSDIQGEFSRFYP